MSLPNLRLLSQTLNGANGIFSYMWLIVMVNVGKYSILIERLGKFP